MTEALCSEINHQKYYSGEFDVEWGQTITEQQDFKKKEMDEYRTWLQENGYDWEDPKLSLGYIKIGQVDIKRTFGNNVSIQEIHKVMSNNLNIKSIRTIAEPVVEQNYPYNLDSNDWKDIQMKGLEQGYESRSLR